MSAPGNHLMYGVGKPVVAALLTAADVIAGPSAFWKTGPEATGTDGKSKEWIDPAKVIDRFLGYQSEIQKAVKT